MLVNVTKVVHFCPKCETYKTGLQTVFGTFMCSGCTNTVIYRRYARKYEKGETGIFAPGENPFRN